MKTILIAILSFTTLLARCQENKRIDSASSADTSQNKITIERVTLNEFSKKKKSLQLERLRNVKDNPYLLSALVSQFNLKWEDVSEKIDSLDDRSKLTFIEIVFKNSFEFTLKNKGGIIKILENTSPEEDRQKNLKQTLLLCLRINSKNYTESFSKIDKLTVINWSTEYLLCKTVENNKEDEFSIDLLNYLSKRNDWNKLGHDLSYWALYETKDSNQNNLFKQFFIEQLETKGYQENPWNGHSDFLPKWLSKDEIIEVCKKKKTENYSNERFFYGEKRTVTNLEEYVSVASFYQAKYFSYSSSLELISQLKIIDQKLDLIYMLTHLQELTSEQKNELFQIILDEKEQISSYNSSELLMPILRTLKPNIAFEYINETFPNLYSKWTNPEHLRQVFYDSKFDFKNFIDIANEIKYFHPKLSYPSDYLLRSYMSGNRGFRLNNISSAQAIFEENNIGVSIYDLYYGDYEFPLDYDFIIESTFRDLFKSNFGEEIKSYYEFEILEESIINYNIHVFFKGRDFKMDIKEPIGNPDNEAIIHLMNEILWENESEKQLIKYGYNNFYCLANKAKFEQLVEKVKNTDNIIDR